MQKSTFYVKKYIFIQGPISNQLSYVSFCPGVFCKRQVAMVMLVSNKFFSSDLSFEQPKLHIWATKNTRGPLLSMGNTGWFIGILISWLMK